MKKTFLIIALLLVSFWCINVKADDDATLPITTDPETAVIEEKKEEKVEVKEEAKVETKAEVKAEPVRGDTKAASGKVTMNIIDTRNNSKKSYEATEGNSKALNWMVSGLTVDSSTGDFILKEGNFTYTFKGFYDAASGGNKIGKDYVPGDTYPELKSLYSNEDMSAPNKYRLYTTKAEVEENKDVNVYIQWDKKEKHNTALTIVIKELSESGATVNDTQNELRRNVTNKIYVGNGQTHTTEALKVTEFISGDYKYVVDGWYEEDGKTPVPESMYYNGDPTRIRIPFTCTEDSPAELTLTYVLVWKEYRNPIYKFNIVDKVSDGSHKWDNTTGHFGSYTHTFKAPSEKTHYQFLYYKMNDIIKNAGEKYSHDISAQGYDTSVEETFDAYWQADVTLDLYDENTKLISSESSFESVSINYDTERVGYRFLGWFDAEGNKVEETTFYPNELGTKPEPKQITLYAKYEEILINVGVTKVWDDEDNQDGIRPDSINVTLSNGTTVTLNEENEWSATVENVPEYKDGEKVNYTWTEDEVEGYELTDTSVEDNITTLTNTHIPEMLEIIVNKVWADDDNESGKRPESVTIALVVDEEDIETVELNEEVEWTHTFKVPAYSNGEKIEYDVKELNVPEGYEVSYEGSVEDGFTIHNVLGQGEGEPEEPHNNPQTGDNIYLYLITLLISMSGLGICVKEYALDK